ncbi:hypothetical protein CP8484711_2191, partial [Chlamydia psittaci 84-8471/1]
FKVFKIILSKNALKIVP